MQLCCVLRADKDNIATFAHVVRQQSLAGAARHLGIPKSTVSRRIARLEAQLGVKLVHRDARRISLTAEGRRFYDSVVHAVDALELAVERIEDSSRAPRGMIRITAPGDYGRMVLVPRLCRFLERYPDISLDLILTNRFVDLAQEGVHLAVRAGTVSEPNLIARKLGPSELQLGAHPDLRVDESDIRSLQAQDFVLYRARGTSQVLRLERNQDGRTQSVSLNVSGKINVDDYSAMVALVAEAQGVGLMPKLHLEEGRKSNGIVRIFSEWRLEAGAVNLVYSTRQLPERVRLLIDFLSEELRDGKV
mgnify:CR=1 FL=1